MIYAKRMNPVVIDIGPLVVRSYTAWLAGGIVLALILVAWRGYRFRPDHAARWLDVGIAAVLAGIAGARLLHVALEWDYFSGFRGEITKISLGGLAWHGALLAGVLAGLVVANLRRVPFRPWTDAVALVWPVGLIAAWIACRRAGCGYGYEVRTLADWPGWLVEELPDVFGLVAPRLEVQVAGALWGGVLLALALLLTWRDWLPGVRFWLILGLSSLGLALLGFFRADPAPLIEGRRADQVFDLLVLLLSTLIGSGLWLRDRRTILMMEKRL
jgi:prolipoprotein diacylglyceryltransferase